MKWLILAGAAALVFLTRWAWKQIPDPAKCPRCESYHVEEHEDGSCECVTCGYEWGIVP